MIPYIREKKIKEILTEKSAFRLAAEAFALLSKKQALMPPKLYLTLPGFAGQQGDFRAMPAFYEKNGGGACGIKWVSVFPDNEKLKIPTVNGTILLNSGKTGELLAILDANTLTAMRTAAAAAVASRFLAGPKPKILAIVGAGVQAGYQLRAHAALYSFDEIKVWGYRPGEAQNFCRRFHPLFKSLRPCRSVRECVDSADILITCTSSRSPLVSQPWVKGGAHINAIGADAKGKEELDPRLVTDAKVVVDEWEQASHSGEINVPVSKSLFGKKNLYAELAEIVSGQKRGRTSDKEITLFDSTGLAILDIYFAKFIYDRTR